MTMFLLQGISFAQDDNKDKTKKTTTVPQKVHNTVSKHKKYSGTKTKHKGDDGKVKNTNGEEKIKKD
jgi:hypothetical protein